MKLKKLITLSLFLLSKIVHLIAEIEVYFSRPGFPLLARKLELLLLGIKFAKPIWIGSNITIYNPKKITIGSGCAIPSNTQFINHVEIFIGDDFIAAPDLVLNSGGHDPLSMHPICKPINIGRRVWCGQRVTILAGVTIGDDVVVAAGSVVTHDIPANSICAGVPASVIKTIDRTNIDIWKWYMH